MTNEQLNEAIHKWLGFCCHDFSGTETYKNDDGTEGELDVCIHCGAYEASETEWRDPDYCESHYSVREFLERVEDSEVELMTWKEWFSDLYCRTDKTGSQSSVLRSIRKAVFANPRELAEAGAKAVGIWREDD